MTRNYDALIAELERRIENLEKEIAWLQKKREDGYIQINDPNWYRPDGVDSGTLPVLE